MNNVLTPVHISTYTHIFRDLFDLGFGVRKKSNNQPQSKYISVSMGLTQLLVSIYREEVCTGVAEVVDQTLAFAAGDICSSLWERFDFLFTQHFIELLLP